MIFLIFVAIAGIEYYILEKDDVFYTVAPWSIPSILLIALLAKFHEFDTFFKFTPLVFLGNISFELFLWHLLVKQSVWLVNDKCILCYDDVMLSNITIVISVIIAYAYNRCSFKFISENYDRLYDKWILRER